MKKPLSKSKLILRILLGILALPLLLVLYIVGTILLDPVTDHFERARFTKLDNESQVLFRELQSISVGEENWEYEAKCSEILGGFKFVAEYNCHTQMETEVLAVSVDQVNKLHEKYLATIDGFTFFEAVSELDKQLPGYFGVKFVVSSAEKVYTFKNDSDIVCRYIIELTQPIPPSGVRYNVNYGAGIEGGVGRLFITINCTDKTDGNWYKADGL